MATVQSAPVPSLCYFAQLSSLEDHTPLLGLVLLERALGPVRIALVFG